MESQAPGLAFAPAAPADEPEALAEEAQEAPQDEPPMVDAVQVDPGPTPSAEPDSVAAAAPQATELPEPAQPPITFGPDGARYADLDPGPDAVRCVCLQGVAWLGVLQPPGAELRLPPDRFARLERLGHVRAL